MSYAEEMDKHKDFYISYHNTDLKWAEWIAWQIEEEGHTVTIKAWDFQPGSHSILNVQKATQTSKCILLVLSQSYLKTDSTAPEWAAFFKRYTGEEQRKILPVCVQECEPDGLLGPIVLIDLVGLNEQDARAKLLADIKSGRHKPLAPPKFPIKHTITQEVPGFPASSKIAQRQSPPSFLPEEDRQPSPVPRRRVSPNSLPREQPDRSRLSLFKHVHWLVYVSAGMVAMFILFLLGETIFAWSAQRLDDLHYGNPRTYQTDKFVGDGDSVSHPSHFIVVNLNRQVIVVQFVSGDPNKSSVYVAPFLIGGPGGDLAPVTVDFRNVTHHSDNKLDMIITIHIDQSSVFVFVNTGTGFRPSNPEDKLHL